MRTHSETGKAVDVRASFRVADTQADIFMALFIDEKREHAIRLETNGPRFLTLDDADRMAALLRALIAEANR